MLHRECRVAQPITMQNRIPTIVAPPGEVRQNQRWVVKHPGSREMQPVDKVAFFGCMHRRARTQKWIEPARSLGNLAADSHVRAHPRYLATSQETLFREAK